MRVKILVFLFFSFFFASCMNTQATIADENNLAPDFSLFTTEGKNISLGDYRNRSGLILFFWTTWCPYCRSELKNMNSEHRQLKEEGWEVLAINVGESLNRVQRFKKSESLTFKILTDESGAVASSYGILGVPTFVVIDRKGKVLFSDNHFQKEKIERFNPD